jgi:molybdopterin biosynthesis enzyme
MKIMFAVNRTASVPGRITFMIVSIHTVNGIRTVGVPCVPRSSNIWFMLLVHPNIINLAHNDSVMVKCLVLVNMYGNNFL